VSGERMTGEAARAALNSWCGRPGLALRVHGEWRREVFDAMTEHSICHPGRPRPRRTPQAQFAGPL
jgi:hypothetical protein